MLQDKLKKNVARITGPLLLKIERAYYHDQLTVPRNLSPSCIENVFCHACLKTQNCTKNVRAHWRYCHTENLTVFERQFRLEAENFTKYLVSRGF